MSVGSSISMWILNRQSSCHPVLQSQQKHIRQPLTGMHIKAASLSLDRQTAISRLKDIPEWEQSQPDQPRSQLYIPALTRAGWKKKAP
jgi:hypothetical protein